jgi:hypothetical protein
LRGSVFTADGRSVQVAPTVVRTEPAALSEWGSCFSATISNRPPLSARPALDLQPRMGVTELLLLGSKSHRPQRGIVRHVRSASRRSVKRQPPSAGRPCVRVGGLCPPGPPRLKTRQRARRARLKAAAGRLCFPRAGCAPRQGRSETAPTTSARSPAQAPERRPCAIVRLPTSTARSVPAPSGSRVTSKSMNGASLINCVLIRSISSSRAAFGRLLVQVAGRADGCQFRMSEGGYFLG